MTSTLLPALVSTGALAVVWTNYREHKNTPDMVRLVALSAFALVMWVLTILNAVQNA